MTGGSPDTFDSVDNFRDFGGAASVRGGRIATGRLFRSAHLGTASDEDLRRLQALGIALVTDLRRTTERIHQPSRWTTFGGRLIRSNTDDRAVGPHLAFLRQGDLSDAGVERYLSNYYRQAPFEPRHLTLFAETFAALDETSGALLVHCTAGKDRTGLLAALIQRALGATPQAVMDDFLLTNALMMTPSHRAQVIASLTPIVGKSPSEAILRGFMGVSAHHLDLAFTAIDERAGGLEAYLSGIGVDRACLARLDAKLLVQTPPE